MRLGVLLPPLGGPAAGLAVYVSELVPRLLDRHADWVLFTTDEGALPPWSDRAPVARLCSRPTRMAHRLHRRLGRLAAVQLELRRRLERQRVDALLIPFHDGVLGAPVPQAVIVHDLTPLRRPRSGRSLERLYLRTLFRRVARSAESLIAVSASTRDDLGRFWGLDRDAIAVVGEGTDRALFRVFQEPEIATVLTRHEVTPPYLFYAGTLAPHKNLGTAVAMLARLRRARPEWRLVIAGPPVAGDPAALRRRVEELGQEDAVTLLGYVDRSDLGPLMAGATAFVFPSLAEGFGLAVVEAMASGAVVLAADRTSLPEVVGDGGLLLDPEDPEVWATAVLDLERDAERAAALRHAARRRADRFSWEAAAERIVELMTRLADGSNAGRRG